MDNPDIVMSLATAGLDFREMLDPLTPVIPPTIAGFATCCPWKEGVRGFTVAPDDFSDDRQLADAVNVGWYHLALEEGLFSEHTEEFLLAVNCSSERWPGK